MTVVGLHVEHGPAARGFAPDVVEKNSHDTVPLRFRKRIIRQRFCHLDAQAHRDNRRFPDMGYQTHFKDGLYLLLGSIARGTTFPLAIYVRTL